MAYTEFTFRKPLYHYTNVDAFRAIASSGQMRFSRADQTNDPYEVIFVRNVILNFLKHMLENATNSKSAHFFQGILSSYEAVSDPARMYVACWTQRANSIPMWRLYANEGRGLIFSLRPRAFSGFQCRLSEVNYLEGETGIIDHVRSYVKKSHGETLGTTANTENIPLLVRMIEATMNTKKIEWDYEDEVRLIFSYDEGRYSSIEEFIDPLSFAELQKYAPNAVDTSEERQYVFQDFGKRTATGVERSGAISEVILGPNCEWTREDAVEFLSSLGYENYSVVRSSIEWR